MFVGAICHEVRRSQTLCGAQQVLQVLWLVPMTERVQWGTLVVAEIFNAWQGIDVFVLAILASILEISKFAQFMIGDMCDGIFHCTYRFCLYCVLTMVEVAVVGV